MKSQPLWNKLLRVFVLAVIAVCFWIPASAHAADDYIYVPSSSNTTAANANANTYPGCSVLGNTSWKCNFTEMVYLKSELGTTARTITKVGWYTMNSVARTWSSDSFKVYMGMTSKSSISSPSDLVTQADMTEVYSNSETITVLGTTGGQWIEFTLDTPFSYTGSDNLAVAVVTTAGADAGGLINTANQSNANKGYTAWSDSQQSYFADYASIVTNINSATKKAAAKNRPSIRLGYSSCTHENATLSSTTPATCTAGGYETWHCPDCGQDIKKNETAAINHANATKTSTTPATCTEGGYETWHCPDCGEDLIKNETSALGHEWPSEPNYRGNKDGTENENGKYWVYKCTHDASHIKTTSADPTVWDGTSSTVWTHGDGTAEDPYLIESAANLAYFRDQVNGGTKDGMYANTYFKQTVDIDLADETWTPIGVYSSNTNARVFCGHYDGDGHTVSGLKVQHTAVASYPNYDQASGLFAYVKGTADARASIEGIVVEGAVTETASGTSYTGGIVGYANYTDFSNCGNDASVTGGYQYAGGIVGYMMYSTIDGCFNHGDITSTYAPGTSSEYAYAAGIVSYVAGTSSYTTTITNSYNTGAIKSVAFGGGVIGGMVTSTAAAAHTIENCYNAGSVTATTSGTNANKAGGILGYVTSANGKDGQIIKNCYSLSGSAPQDILGCGAVNDYLKPTDVSTMTADEMKAPGFVKTLGKKYIAGTTYPVLYWEAPKGIPEITVQPADAVYVKDADATALSVTATGDAVNGQIEYQWYKATEKDLSDAEAVANATGSTYIPATDELGDFYYYCAVHNDVQSLDGSGPFMVQSDPAHVQVWSGVDAVAPSITTQPSDIESVGQGALSGNKLTVEATFAGAGESEDNCVLSYKWQVADSAEGQFADIDGATEASYNAPTSAVGTKYYRCVVTNTRERQSQASSTSEVASVTVEGYKIDSYAKLKEFAQMVDNGDDFEGRSVTLTADIEVGNDYDPAGDYSTNTVTNPAHYFKGEFDGNGHTITFNNIETDTQYYAIVAAADEGASFHDLAVKGAISSTSTNVAGVVAYSNGAISFVRVGNEADISSTGATGGSSPSHVAGIIGSSLSGKVIEFAQCYNKGDITGNGSRVAGLAAYSKVTMTSCYNTGAIMTTGTYSGSSYPDSIGGLHGSMAPAIVNCYNTGNVSAPNANANNKYSGSITGYTSVTNPTGNDVSYWLTGTNDRARGGTAAQPEGYISKDAETFADEEGDTGVLNLLKAGSYADAWAAGSKLSPAQASPILAWEEPAPAPTTHTVTFVDEDGTSVLKEATEYPEGTAAVDIAKPADPTKTVTPDDGYNYAFDKWVNKDTEEEGIKDVTADATYKATYTKTAKTYEIEYVLNGGTNDQDNPASYTVDTDDITIKPASWDGEGHAFAGWFDNAEFAGDAVTTIPKGSKGKITLHAKWDTTHTVTFLPGKVGSISYSFGTGNGKVNFAGFSGASGTKQVNDNETVASLELGSPTLNTGFFKNWYLDKDASNSYTEGDEVYSIDTPVTGDVTLIAVWDAKRSLIVTVKTAGATLVVTDKTSEAVLDNPTPTSGVYSFQGLNSSHSFSVSVTCDGYGPYTEEFESLTSNTNRTITLAAIPSVTGPDVSTEAGVGDEKTISVNATASNGTLSYQWYKNEENEAVVNEEHAIEGATSASYAPSTEAVGTAYYYCVVNNKAGGTIATAPATYAAATSTVGKFTVKAKYKVKFVDENGSTIKEEKQYIDGTTAADIDKPADPTKTVDPDDGYNYAFDKWVNKDTGEEGIKDVTADVTYKATYTKTAKEYTITYSNMDGAANAEANPEKYTIETDTITLQDASKEGSEFGGWYTNDAFTGDAVTKIEKGSTGDLELFAKWTAVDKSALNDAITAAQNAQDGIKVSEDGKDVDPADKYVTPADKQALDDAIAAAQAVADNASATQAQVDAAKKAVEEAVEAYEAAKKSGSKESAAPSKPETPTTPETPETPVSNTFAPLKLKAAKATKSAVTLGWKAVPGAVKYVLYSNKCSSKNKVVKMATMAKNTYKVTKAAGKKLKKGTYYKFVVEAIDKDGKAISKSRMIHVATKGGKVGNYKRVKAKGKLAVKAGKSAKIKAKAIPASKKKKVKKHSKLAYESSDTTIATVSKKGVVKGLKKGTCTVYVYAQNGVYKAVKVTVK